MSEKTATIKNVQIYAITESAVQYGPPGLINSYSSNRLKYWIPSDLILHRSKYLIGEVDEIEIPQWLAKKKELNFD